MKLKLHEYQSYCVDRIIEKKNVGLFLDMGLGKTLITLMAIKRLIYERFEVEKVLVIAPKKVAEATWQMEIEKWEDFHLLRPITVLGSQRDRDRALKSPGDIYIINRDNVPWIVEKYKNSWPFDMVVVDELSSFKNHASKRFKALASMKPHIKRFIGLTGTPSPNGLLNLWSQLYLIDGGKRLSPNYYSYRGAFFESDYMGYNWKPREGSEEFILEKIKDVCISMKAEDYLELPEMVEDDIFIKLDEKARKDYEEMEKEKILEIEDLEDSIDAASAASLSTKLLQLANGAIYDEEGSWHEVHDNKIEAFKEAIESLEGKSLLVFYSYKHDLERLEKALRNSKLRVRKLESPKDQKDWNDGKIDVLFAHPASSAYGLNLQAGGNHIIWFGLTWDYELYTQANKRLHRQGQKDKVFIHRLIVKDSRDEDVVEALKRKEGTQEFVMESLKARIRKWRQDE